MLRGSRFQHFSMSVNDRDLFGVWYDVMVLNVQPLPWQYEFLNL